MSDNRSPEEIQRDIEQTRARLAEDLDELSYRVSPEGLRDRAETGLEDLKDVALGVTQDTLHKVTDRAEAAGESFSAQLSARPLPLSLLGAALGVGWLLVNAAKQGSRARRVAPVLTPGSPAGTGRLVDTSGEVLHEPEREPDWLTSAGHVPPSTTTLLASAAALLSGAAVGALLPGRQSAESSVRPSANPRERVPVTPPVEPQTTAGAEDASADDAAFRRHFGTTFASSGRDYAFYDPAYRYGAALPGAAMHRNRSWAEAADDARRDWERSHSEPWDEVRDAVREGWQYSSRDRQS